MLPAYARAIVNERAAGQHPPQIIIGIGPEWFRINHHLYPFAFAKEGDFLAGRFDWWWIAGVPVYVESCAETAATLRLLGELADWTAPIWLNFPLHFLSGAEACDLFADIRAGRWLKSARFLEFDPSNDGHCQFWSVERAARYHDRAQAYREAMRREAAAA